MIHLGEKRKVIFHHSSSFELSGGVLLVLNPSTPATCFGDTVRGFRQFKSGIRPNQFVWARWRFFDIPDSVDAAKENAKELIYRFMERGELEVENARDIEFQRLHRIGAKKQDSPRPIIARFLRFPDREKVFKRALELKDEIDVKLYADYPREIQEPRGKLWPRLKRARWEEGKRAFFDKKLTSSSLMDMWLLKTVMF